MYSRLAQLCYAHWLFQGVFGTGRWLAEAYPSVLPVQVSGLGAADGWRGRLAGAQVRLGHAERQPLALALALAFGHAHSQRAAHPGRHGHAHGHSATTTASTSGYRSAACPSATFSQTNVIDTTTTFLSLKLIILGLRASAVEAARGLLAAAHG